VPDPAGITGRVLLDGKPVTYYGVAIDEDANASYSRPVPVRDPAGRFTRRDVAPGTFAIIIVGPGFARRVVEGVHVTSGGMTDVGDITAAGSFRFPQLPPGDYDVHVVSSNTQPSIRATVTAGARTVVAFELPAHPAELRVHAAGCSLISLRTAADEMLRLESCNEGRVTFPEIAPGPYQLCLELSECRPIDVPATAVHAIEITR